MSGVRPDTGETTLDEPAVAAYLHTHRDFFTRHPQLLAELELPHHDSGQAVSLIERQVTVLREQRQNLKHQLQQLTQTARDNEALLERIEQLILTLLEADDPGGVINHLRHALGEQFHAEQVAVKFFQDDGDPDYPLFDKVIARREPVCGHLTPAQAEALFGAEGDRLASGALLPLFHHAHGHCFAIAGIGSTDPHRFHAAMGTTFLRYLSGVLSRLLAGPPGSG